MQVTRWLAARLATLAAALLLLAVTLSPGVCVFYAVPIAAVTIFLVYRFAPGQGLRAWVLALSVPLALLLGIQALGRVSASARSPDGRTLAEVSDRRLPLPDYNFNLRLTSKWLGIIHICRSIFVSPDEGPPTAERLLWSRDGRYLLLVGKRFYTTNESCLASGEALYLLFDRNSDTVYCNATQARCRRFSVRDLAPMDFGESFVPSVAGRWEGCLGGWDEASFFRILGAHRGRDEVRVTKEILQWARRGAVRIAWNESKWHPRRGTFSPIFDDGGALYAPFSVHTGGVLNFPFEPPQARSLFEDEVKRLHFLKRLEEIRGSTSAGELTTISLSTLTDEAAFREFLSLLDWAVRAAGEKPGQVQRGRDLPASSSCRASDGHACP